MGGPDMILQISDDEFRRRRQAVIGQLAEAEFAAFCSFNSTSIFYLTGFYFLPTERPVALLLTAADRALMLVPRLELEHAGQLDSVEVRSYPEYPGTRHPMTYLRELCVDSGLKSARLLVDADGYGSPYGYRGPRLSDLLPEAMIRVDRYLVEQLRMIKSPEEIALIRESCRWGNLAHELLQEYTAEGLTELEVVLAASAEATLTMMKTLGRGYRPVGPSPGARAGYRGQIGPNSALPHAVTTNARFSAGDVLVTGAGATVYGYNSELERTMFIGEPDAARQKWFGLMCAAGEAAFAAIRPGRPCREVEQEVLRFYEQEGLGDYWRHHTGHALGLLGHEAPFFDPGDETTIEPGMVFSVEPGIYIMGLGGFRHSDTLVVTDDGCELLTYYPRDLESLII